MLSHLPSTTSCSPNWSKAGAGKTLFDKAVRYLLDRRPRLTAARKGRRAGDEEALTKRWGGGGGFFFFRGVDEDYSRLDSRSPSFVSTATRSSFPRMPLLTFPPSSPRFLSLLVSDLFRYLHVWPGTDVPHRTQRDPQRDGGRGPGVLPDIFVSEVCL